MDQTKEQITAYIMRHPRRFQRGTADCCAWAGGWAKVRSGKFPGKEFRKPTTTREALRILRNYDGMAGFFGMILERDGWQITATPRNGDIVVIESKSSLDGATVGIWNKGAVITLTEQGHIYVMKNPILKGAWKWA